MSVAEMHCAASCGWGDDASSLGSFVHYFICSDLMYWVLISKVEC
jgi:hypothetical protein